MDQEVINCTCDEALKHNGQTVQIICRPVPNTSELVVQDKENSQRIPIQGSSDFRNSQLLQVVGKVVDKRVNAKQILSMNLEFSEKYQEQDKWNLVMQSLQIQQSPLFQSNLFSHIQEELLTLIKDYQEDFQGETENSHEDS